MNLHQLVYHHNRVCCTSAIRTMHTRVTWAWSNHHQLICSSR